VEKRKPSYDLGSVRAWAASPKFAATGRALETALALGFNSEDMATVIQTIRREQFIKSMTSYDDHRTWQDVYHVPSEAGVLYVKFRADVVTEFLLLSFKEKDNG
jgi:motility quorum-sensing regulator / GCU-specific mRNA interferase toxin